MGELNRRRFLASAVSASGVLMGGDILRAAGPSLAIAHYKSPPAAPDGIAEEARRLTRAAIEALGGMGRFVSKGQKVWVKPNIGWDRRPEQAACSNPDVVATVVSMCYQAGASKVVVSDNPCVEAEKSFARSGIQAAAAKAGAQCDYMDDRKFRKMALKGAQVLKEWEIYAGVVESDRLINIAIAKHHSLCRATLGMKNLMGAAGGARNRFHQDIGKAVADLAGFLKPQLVVLDAVRILTANGPTGGNLADVKRKDAIVAGVDQVAVDAYGATLFGLKSSDIGYVVEGQARGLGTMNYQSLSPARLEV
ncbi:MAG: DUF362 domain-containing protein [Bryobacteraceae bacterium]|jgi:uncharacterized protein (DUF362 family)